MFSKDKKIGGLGNYRYNKVSSWKRICILDVCYDVAKFPFGKGFLLDVCYDMASLT
jgi:hypothetical protein